MNKHHSRARIIGFAKRTINLCNLTINEANERARLYPHERPLDVEPERIARMYALRVLRAARAWQRIDPAWMSGIEAAMREVL